MKCVEDVFLWVISSATNATGLFPILSVISTTRRRKGNPKLYACIAARNEGWLSPVLKKKMPMSSST